MLISIIIDHNKFFYLIDNKKIEKIFIVFMNIKDNTKWKQIKLKDIIMKFKSEIIL
jgi:hypothetical protein